MTLSVQLNGTAHCEIEVPEDMPEWDIRRQALNAIRRHWGGLAEPWNIKNIIYKTGQSVNVITKNETTA